MDLSPPLAVHHDDVVALHRVLDDPGTARTVARRALIVLLSARGLDAPSIAHELGCGVPTVVTWRERYRTAGALGLVDAPRSGRPVSVDATTVLLRTLEPPPLGFVRWTSRLLAEELGVSNASVANTWRFWGIRPTRDAEVALVAAAAPLSGLSAVVGLCVRPGSAVLALERDRRDGRERVAVARRPDLRDRIPDVGSERPGPRTDADVTAFLHEVADRRPGPDTALLVTGLSTALVGVCADLGLSTFVLDPAASWARTARVACLLAAADERGRATVSALRDALDGNPLTPRFTWLRARRREVGRPSRPR